jgi:hypothetical protein
MHFLCKICQITCADKYFDNLGELFFIPVNILWGVV